MTTFSLDAAQVERTYASCLGEGVEVTDAITGPVTLDTCNVLSFDKGRLADHAELVAAMLLELPDEFRESGGGGWSFLNACDDRHGRQWTGLHSTMAELFALGLGLGLVKSLLPRDMWDVLPGGVPYYVVLDKSATLEVPRR